MDELDENISCVPVFLYFHRSLLFSGYLLCSLHETILKNGTLCPVLFKAYAVYATRGIITNMVPAVDNVFHTSNGRSITDALPVPEQTGG